MECSSFACSEPSIAGRHRSPSTSSVSPSLSPAGSQASPFRPALLHPESPVEADLVPARLRLRRRTARPRRSRRKAARRAARRGQDQPHRRQRHFPAQPRRFCSRQPVGRTVARQSGQPAGGLMTYSYTQISQYLTCPRRYRYRYLDGWKEKDTRAAMLFGRAFEQALGALFRREDPGAVLFREWSACKSQDLQLLRTATPGIACCEQGIMLLDPLLPGRPHPQSASRDAICRSSSPAPVGDKNDFVAYIDAIGTLDGTRCLLEWKTSSSRYPEEPDGTAGSRSATGLLLLDDRHLRKSLRSSSSASGWSKFSTCAPPSPTSSARSSASWSKTRSAGSSPRSSCRTAASAFRRTPAAAVRTWGFVWDEQELARRRAGPASRSRRPWLA